MIARALAILAVAGMLGSVHMILRERPVVLSRGADQAVTPGEISPADPADPADSPTDPVATTPDTGTPAETAVDPYAEFAANPIFDAEVKPGALTLREAYTLYESGATFLDARYQEEFDEARIAGAVWMPASRLSSGEGIPAAYEIYTSFPIVIYCTGGDCDASENTAVLLESLGFGFDIRILGMGYDDWAAAGLPVEGFGVQP